MALPLPTSRFQLNDIVLCDYKGTLYEAKIIKVDTSKQHPYKVHYNGFKKSHDEFVPMERLLSMTPENVAVFKHQRAQNEARLKAEAEAKERERLAKESAKKAAKEAAKEPVKKQQPVLTIKDTVLKNISETPARATPVATLKTPAEADLKKSAAKKAKVEAPSRPPRTPKDGEPKLATVEPPKQRPSEIKLPIPDNLKRQLVDDNDFITVQQKLVPLPRTPSVSTILAEYVNECQAASDTEPTLKDAETVIDGLRDFFNAGIGTHLLYRFERVQYREQLNDKDMLPVNVYGAEHLLRLFVKLPPLIADADMTEQQAEPITRHMTRLLKYMSVNADRLFLPTYETTTLEYVRMANPA